MTDSSDNTPSSSPNSTDPDHDPARIVPARMLNEWTYCNRLGILEWLHGEWADNADTIDGSWKHRRVDRAGKPLPKPSTDTRDQDSDPDGDQDKADGQLPGEPTVELVTRSVWLTSDDVGLTAKIDVLEMDDDQVVVVDYKRGRIPHHAEHGVWDPERVQLCAQGLVLRDAGYHCQRGFIYFVDAKRRVEVPFDDALIQLTRRNLQDFRAAARTGQLPPPLEDSPKCPRCSLVGICLPDETLQLASPDPLPLPQRQLLAPRTNALPLYVTTQGAKLRKRKGEILVEVRDRDTGDREIVSRVRVREISQISLFGRVEVTTPVFRLCMRRRIPICFFSYGAWFYGTATGHWHKNVVLREAQYRAAHDPVRSLGVAREIVRSKIRNQRTLLRRNGDLDDVVLAELRRLSDAARAAADVQSLLGLEGAAAALYFRELAPLLEDPDEGEPAFDFSVRNRRPPRDPVNALLSFAYAMLTRDVTAALHGAGFDPYMGFYHQPRYGRPALALDLMEEFRPLIADSVVLTAINNGELRPGHFLDRAHGCSLTKHGRKAFFKCYERRMDQTITHPRFGYQASWRRIVDVQARLLGRHLLGEVPRYVPMETR